MKAHVLALRMILFKSFKNKNKHLKERSFFLQQKSEISDLSVIMFGHVFCKMWRQVDFYDTVSVICIIWFID